MEVAMLSMTRQTQMDRMKAAAREAVAYVDEIANDEQLRKNLRSAMGHGAEARDRIRKDLADGDVATRLADDRKLRKTIRAMLDDLDGAGERMRRKNRHRLRNVLLVLVGVGAAAAAIPIVRRRFVSSPPGDAAEAAIV